MKYIIVLVVSTLSFYTICPKDPNLNVFVQGMEKKASDLASDIQQMSSDLKHHEKAEDLLPEMKKMQDTMDEVQVIIDKVRKAIEKDKGAAQN